MPPVEEFSVSGWYLRGDIGMTNQRFKGLHQRLYDVPGTRSKPVGMGWDSSTFFGLGVGYKFNDWFRADFTGEYRGKANFHGSDNVTFTGGHRRRQLLRQQVRVGVHGQRLCRSRHLVVPDAVHRRRRRHGQRQDQRLPRRRLHLHRRRLNIGTAYAEDANKWNFAWALHAGLTYKVTPSMSIDLGYRYIDLGSGTTGGDARLRRQLHQRRAVHLQPHHVARLQTRRPLDARAASADPADVAAAADAARLGGIAAARAEKVCSLTDSTAGLGFDSSCCRMCSCAPSGNTSSSSRCQDFKIHLNTGRVGVGIKFSAGVPRSA